MSFWHRLAIAAAVFACVTLLARLVDWRLARKPLAANQPRQESKGPER